MPFPASAGPGAFCSVLDGRIRLFGQQLQLLCDYMLFVRPAIVLRDHKLKILVYRAEFSLQDILILPHFL